jgi:hypothetical protein
MEIDKHLAESLDNHAEALREATEAMEDLSAALRDLFDMLREDLKRNAEPFHEQHPMQECG